MAHIDKEAKNGERDSAAADHTERRRRCRLHWKPTSAGKLADVEQRILKCMKSTTSGRFVKTNSSNIWTVTVNAHLDAVPLVLVHGMGGGVAMWIQNLDSLGNTRPIYALDLLGFGRSSRPTFSTDAEEAEAEFVRSLEEWRQEVKLDRFILLGHSLGGFVSSAYAIQNPGRIEHLILADPWGYAEKPTDTEFRQKYPLWARALVKVLQPFNPFTALRVAGPYGPGIVKRFRPDLKAKYANFLNDDEDLMLQYLYHCNAQKPSGEIAAKTLQTQIRWAKHPMINRITALDSNVPMTFIHGQESWLDGDVGDNVKQLRAGSDVETHTVLGAGHHVYADRPRVFNHIVQQICDTVDALRGTRGGHGVESSLKRTST
ncbi:(Lyso)-N-acylphosphatidylethanolamine lipase-like [Haliotis cracherodii]|uniref:(Lyso)-N-acylphosphatidylethanolamine lipase-like n=1 Tax=Haliotis cracherodii TaxID=6455 RepID=UPI0039EB06E1